MPLKTFPFDAADYLDCDEAVEAFLQDALDSNEPVEIADALVISVKTVDRHRENIMHKLNLHNRVELVKYAIEKGLITVG